MPETQTPEDRLIKITLPVSSEAWDAVDRPLLEHALGEMAWEAGRKLIDADKDEGPVDVRFF